MNGGSMGFPYHPPGHAQHDKCLPYHLKCRVQIRKYSYEDIWRDGKSRGITEAQTIVLHPVMSTQTQLCFNTWLPLGFKDNGQSVDQELGAELGAPVYGYSYLTLHRADSFHNAFPYFLVMSLGVEEVMKKWLHGQGVLQSVWGKIAGREIDVKILGQHEFHLADGAIRHDVPLQRSAPDTW